MKLKNLKKKIKREDLKYETKKYVYDLQQCETIKSFHDSIFTREITIVEAEEVQSNLLNNKSQSNLFNNKSRPRF